MRGKTIVATGAFGALGRAVVAAAAERGANVAALDAALAAPAGRRTSRAERAHPRRS